VANKAKGLSNGEAAKRLREQCRMQREIIAGENLATPEELADFAPGGKENPDPGLWGWMRYSQHLTRFQARGGGSTGASSGADDADIRYLLAYAASPRPVTLSTRNEDGSPRSLLVYPKSIGALMDVHYRDVLIGWLLDRISLLDQGDTDPASLQQVSSAWAQVELQHNLIAWTLTTETPGLPFDPNAPTAPELPEYVRNLAPDEVLSILQAHQEVNNRRLRSLNALFDLTEKRGKDRPFRFSVFVGAVADRLGIPAGQLMWDWTYAELLGQSGISSQAQREAHEDAESEAKRSRKRNRHDEDDD
jgi:hypothetical protein